MSDNLEVGEGSREIIKDKLRQNFDGKIVRKDLTKKIKEGANVRFMFLSFYWVNIAVQTMMRLSSRVCRMSSISLLITL